MHYETYEVIFDDLKRDEGFVGMPYDDHLGHQTIDYGTLLPVTEEEAEMLLRHRLRQVEDELSERLEKEYGIFFHTLPPGAQYFGLQAGYQLGVPGLIRFRKTWALVRAGDWLGASKEALRSRWARQTPKRARRVAEWLRCGLIDREEHQEQP